jgi:hypothetical protein
MTEHLGQTVDFILGQEFLTWLWHKSETQDGLFTDKGGREFALFMEQRIVVQGGEGESLEIATVAGPMSELREARLGLATGKKVTRALIRIERDADTWQFTLKAEDFSLNSLRTPYQEKVGPDDDPDALLLEKLFLVESCLELIDSLYANFMYLRLTPASWEEETSRIRAWIKDNA